MAVDVVVDDVDEGLVMPKFSMIKGDELPTRDMLVLLGELLLAAAAYIICFSTSKQATYQRAMSKSIHFYRWDLYLLLIKCLPYVYFFNP